MSFFRSSASKAFDVQLNAAFQDFIAELGGEADSAYGRFLQRLRELGEQRGLSEEDLRSAKYISESLLIDTRDGFWQTLVTHAKEMKI